MSLCREESQGAISRLQPDSDQASIGVATYGALGHVPPPLEFQQFISLIRSASLWSYTKYDSNLLCEMSSRFVCCSY